MAAEEYSPDPFDESPPKEMNYLKNPKKMTISQFENIPKKLIADKNLEEGKIYYIEDVGRRKKDYREVYQGMYFPDPYSKDNKTLTFKYVSIIVAPFGDGGMPMGFPKKNHKFYEATSIPSGIDQDSRSLGALYVLTALTLVSPNAADAMPWLYNSVV